MGSPVGDVVDNDSLITPCLIFHLVADRVDQLPLEEEELGRFVMPDLSGFVVVPKTLLAVEGKTSFLHDLVEVGALVGARPELGGDAARSTQAPEDAVGIVGRAGGIGEEQAREAVGPEELAPL